MSSSYAPSPFSQVNSLLVPVVLTMALTVALSQALGPTAVRGGLASVMVYHERTTDSAATIAGGVALNALMMVGLLFVVTTCLLLLYKLRCMRLIYGWLCFSVGSLLFVFGSYIAQQLLVRNGVAMDAPSFYLLAFNFAVVGTLAVFWETGPRLLRQGTLVLVSALIAWMMLHQLPEWTTWGVLGAVALWDIIAVLLPRGPLRLIVEEAERRDEPIPGLVYDGDDIKLGLGDFIFYSLLVGHAAMRNQATLVACAVSVLAGLCATLALLPIMQRALPALPISIAVGTAVYFASSWLITPLISAVAACGLLL
jgi:presenilin 1